MMRDPGTVNGKKCSVCGTVFQARVGSQAVWETQDHANLAECVKALAARVKKLEEKK
jgi:hypothetical protein